MDNRVHLPVKFLELLGGTLHIFLIIRHSFPKLRMFLYLKNVAVIFKPVMVKVARRGSLNPHELPPGTSNGAKYDLVGASGEFRVTAPWKWKGSGDPRRPEEIWGG